MNILSGPKLGDFIHSLIVPKYLYDNGFNINPNWVEPALTAQINGLA